MGVSAESPASTSSAFTKVLFSIMQLAAEFANTAATSNQSRVVWKTVQFKTHVLLSS